MESGLTEERKERFRRERVSYALGVLGVLEYTFGSCSYSICPSSRMMKVGSRNRTPTFQGGAMFQPGGSDQVVPCIPPPASRALKTPKSNPVGLKS